MFDFAIIGAGISGASIAYSLNKLGKKVVVIDKGSVATGGSGAAGAFLSPKICSNSKYSSFIDESFKFSIDFYRQNFSEFLQENGILRILKSEDEIQKCKKHEDNLPANFKFLQQNQIKYLKLESCKYGGYFFDDGALVDSVAVIKSMLKTIQVKENVHVENLKFKDGFYQIGDISAIGVILCVGSSDEFEQTDYCKLKKIYGHRLDIKTFCELPFHLHKECSISAKENSILHVGATHIPSYQYEKNKTYEDEISSMLELAKSCVDLKDYKIQKIHFGVRSSTTDFFPALGHVINAKETLQKYPYIKKGALVPKEKYIYHPNLYIHAGHVARAFVSAPNTAKILSRHICNNEEIDNTLDTQRLFLKSVRK